MLFRIFYDDVHRLHSDPYGKHPENPSRLGRALSALKFSRAWGLISIYNIPDANVSLLYRIHDRGYVEMIERM
jgi:acetoin utilization deacetylase AcuC-like enzyme